MRTYSTTIVCRLRSLPPRPSLLRRPSEELRPLVLRGRSTRIVIPLAQLKLQNILVFPNSGAHSTIHVFQYLCIRLSSRLVCAFSSMTTLNVSPVLVVVCSANWAISSHLFPIHNESPEFSLDRSFQDRISYLLSKCFSAEG